MTTQVCSQCLIEFSSRNKLFAHLNACTGGTANKNASEDIDVDGAGGDANDEPSTGAKRKATTGGPDAQAEGNNCGGSSNGAPQDKALEDFSVDTILRVATGATTSTTTNKTGDTTSDAKVAFPFRVVVKPQGMNTTGGKGPVLQAHDDLGLEYMLGPVAHPMPPRLPGQSMLHGYRVRRALPVHRLDKPTGGVVLCSESRECEGLLKAYFRERTVQKRYRAICHGRIDHTKAKGFAATTATASSSSSGSNNNANDVRIFEEEVDGKPSTTGYRVVHETKSQRHGWLTTVDLYPITGRTHQLRKHCRSLGCPIVGDDRYAQAHMWPEDRGTYPYLFLWALEISFPDPNLPAAPATNIASTGKKAGAGVVSEDAPVPLWLSPIPHVATKGPWIDHSFGRYRCVIPEPAYYREYRDHNEKEADAAAILVHTSPPCV